MSKSNYLENAVLDLVLGRQAFTPPSIVYLALFTAAPGETGGGTEVLGGNYSRLAVPNDETNWPAATGGVKSNGLDLTFALPTGSWGTITHVAFMDAPTGGNMLLYGSLLQAASPNVGVEVKFPAGTLQVTED